MFWGIVFGIGDDYVHELIEKNYDMKNAGFSPPP